MKRLWIAVALLVAVVGLCTTSTIFRHRQAERLLENLEQLEAIYEQGDIPRARQMAEELAERYEKVGRILLCYTAHGDMAESMETAQLLPTLLELGGGEELSMEITRLREEWNHLKEIDDPTLWNIL